MPTDREWVGGAVPTTVVGTLSAGATSISIAASTGWPTGTGSDTFTVVIDRKGADGAAVNNEEKILIESRSGGTLTVATSGRGYDGTAAASHSAGAPIEICIDTVWLQAVNDHLVATAAAHAATAISNTPAGNIAATTVQAAINELDSEKAAAAEPIAAAHIVDTSAAHDASAIGFTPVGTIAGSDVQTAVAEVATDAAAALSSAISGLDATYATDAALASHEADTTSIHGITNTALIVVNSRQVISGAGLTGGGDLSADRTLAVGAGTGITVNADDVAIDAALVDLGAASTTWTATWSGTSANPGNAVISKRWRRTGRHIEFWYSAIFGTTTVIPSTQLGILLPVVAVDPGNVKMPIGEAIFDNNGTLFSGEIYIDHANDTGNDRFRVAAHLKGVSDYTLLDSVDTNSPFAWSAASTDHFAVHGSYEAAS